jgi:predicted nucleic acid-binding protein
VLIDFLADRKPFSRDAARLFDYSLKQMLTIYVSAVSFNNIYYIIRQSRSHAVTLKLLNELNTWTEVIDVTNVAIQKALVSEFKDFEDAIQYNCAKSVKRVEFIVTRDTKDFKSSALPVLTPTEAVSLLESIIG